MTKYAVRVERFRSSMDVAYVTVTAANEDEALSAANLYANENEAEIDWRLDVVEETENITTEYTTDVREETDQ